MRPETALVLSAGAWRDVKQATVWCGYCVFWCCAYLLILLCVIAISYAASAQHGAAGDAAQKMVKPNSTAAARP